MPKLLIKIQLLTFLKKLAGLHFKQSWLRSHRLWLAWWVWQSELIIHFSFFFKCTEFFFFFKELRRKSKIKVYLKWLVECLCKPKEIGSMWTILYVTKCINSSNQFKNCNFSIFLSFFFFFYFNFYKKNLILINLNNNNKFFFFNLIWNKHKFVLILLKKKKLSIRRKTNDKQK